MHQDIDNTLPLVCAAKHPSDNRTIMIKRGEMGYFEAPLFMLTEGVESFNARNGITDAQCSAMVAGSMFGWDCPGAFAVTYEKQRKPRSRLR